MIKKIIFILTLAPMIGFGQQGKKNASGKTTPGISILKSHNDSVSYAFGLKIASDLKSSGIDRLNYEAWSKAMEQVFKGEKTEITESQAQELITRFMSKGSEKKSTSLIAEGDKFLAENKTRPGVITLPSGLQYLVLKQGTGPKPKPGAEVTVHYKGNLLNGKQFDSSYDRGEPLSFKLSRVIPGWVEGVQLMQEGSKYRFFIPWKLAYGPEGAGQDIPPYSVLIFEIELLNAVK